MERLDTSSAIPGLNRDELYEQPLLVSPLAEQKRIVAKVEELLVGVNAARERLARVPAILKRFRQAVLAAAFSGRLTAHTRQSENGIGTLQRYLDRIAAQRCASFEDGIRRRGRNRRRPAPIPVENRDDFPAIPENWQWESADAVCAQITDGEHIQPRYQKAGRPLLTAKHIRDGYIEFADYGLIAEDDFQRCLQRCAPQDKDVLIVSVGATTGRAAIVQKSQPFAIVRSILLLRPLIRPQFLLRWVQSPWCFRWMVGASGASAQPHLYIGDIKAMPVPIPPLEEQELIVKRVNALLALADMVEERVSVRAARAEKLTQAILDKAFRGELVPTEAELARTEGRPYEPASALLDRIRSSKEVAPREVRRTRARVGPTPET